MFQLLFPLLFIHHAARRGQLTVLAASGVWLGESLLNMAAYMADARADPVASALLDQLPFPIGTHISTPVVLDDAGFAQGMRKRVAELNTQIGELIACEAVLGYSKAVDKGPRPSNISAGDYSRYEVRFTVASMGCKDHSRQFSAAAR